MKLFFSSYLLSLIREHFLSPTLSQISRWKIAGPDETETNDFETFFLLPKRKIKGKDPGEIQ